MDSKWLSYVAVAIAAGLLNSSLAFSQGAPSITSASCPQPGTTATVNWTQVSGDVYYSLWQDEKTVCGPVNDQYSCQFTSTPGTHSLQINGEPAGGPWYSSPTYPMNCYSGSAPSITSASCPSPGTVATVTWTDVPGDDYYSLWWNNGTGWQTVYGPEEGQYSYQFTTPRVRTRSRSMGAIPLALGTPLSRVR